MPKRSLPRRPSGQNSYRRGRMVTKRAPRAKLKLPLRELFLSVLVLSAFAGLLSLWFSSLLKVNLVMVEGEFKIDAAQVQEAAGAQLPQQNMVLLNTAAIEQRISSRFPQLQKVKVVKHWWPNSIVIELQEKYPAIAWHTGNAVFGVDSDGVVIGVLDADLNRHVYAFGARSELPVDAVTEASPTIEPAPPILDALPYPLAGELPADILKPGDRVLEPSQVVFILAVFDRLPAIISGRSISLIEMGEFDDLSVILQDDFEIRFKMTYTVDSAFKRLADTLEEAERIGKNLNQYVDLRFEKVYGK